MQQIAVGLPYLSQPLLQQLGLWMLPPVVNQLHPSAQLTDGDRSQKKRGVLSGSSCPKSCTPASSQRPLCASLIKLVSIKNISSLCLIVQALEVGVHTDIRHGSQ